MTERSDIRTINVNSAQLPSEFKVLWTQYNNTLFPSSGQNTSF